MDSRWNCLSVVLLVLSTSSLTAQEKKSEEVSLEQAAKSFVTMLNKGEFTKATKTFDSEMLKVMPASELKQAWEKVLDLAGEYKKQTGNRRETADKYEIIYVTCEFANMKLDARVVFDKDKKIAGLFFVPTTASSSSGEEEKWEGTLDTGATQLRLIFRLFKQKDESYTGTMDSPDQGATGIVLDEVSVKGDKVRLELKSSKMVFEGKRAKDGKELTGDLNQVGQSFPLTLKRVTTAKK